ncbi:hypothetical protein ACFXPI_16480 [Streptomyces sp. NPDC059104]|uniref:hypothetical protein n=1 Tax=Streptomyces TaxID=1883 RepID=UPI0033C43B77
MAHGLHISFLGADGIGKTTLVRTIASALRERGLTVREVSWRSCLDRDQNPWVSDTLQQLWLETFRLLYGGSRVGDEWLRLPRDFAEWRDGEWEDRLAELAPGPARPAGPLAAALVELAGNFVLAAEVIRPAVSRGEIVLQETFPFKHTLKELLIARRLAGADEQWSDALQQVQTLLEQVFGSPLLRPELGILVDGPIELAYRWRMAQSGRLGLLEDYRSAGTSGEEGFSLLQQDSVQLFRDMAKRWDWAVHTVDDSGLEPNLRRGLDLVLAQPCLQEVIGRLDRQDEHPGQPAR